MLSPWSSWLARRWNRASTSRRSRIIAGMRRRCRPAPTRTIGSPCVCRGSGETERALAEEEAALGIDARHAEAHDLRGGLLAGRGRLDEAIGELRAAVEIAPDNVAFRVGLARVLVTARRFDDAGSEIQRALALQPDSPDAHAAAGALLLARGQLEPALTALQRALARRPDDDDVRLDLAGILERLGRRVAHAGRHQTSRAGASALTEAADHLSA